MQQDRSLKGVAKKASYQFMLRLKMPCGEVPGPLFAELDDISNKWGHGDLRATTRQAFQLHGVLKGNLKSVVAAIANIGSNTYGGCGDISRNVMTPPVHFPNNPAYVYCNQYARAIAELFKPMTNSFYEIWLGKTSHRAGTARSARLHRASLAVPLSLRPLPQAPAVRSLVRQTASPPRTSNTGSATSAPST